MIHLKTFIDCEAKTVRFEVCGDKPFECYKTYDITDNPKKQKSLLKLLQSDRIKYYRYYGESKMWGGVGRSKPFTYYLIWDINEDRTPPDFLLGRDENKPPLV